MIQLTVYKDIFCLDSVVSHITSGSSVVFQSKDLPLAPTVAM